MIQGISSLEAYLAVPVSSMSGIGAGKRIVPVRPNDSLYLFKHVFGVPARGGSRTVPLEKLRILDNLIDRLVSLRGERHEVLPVTRDNVDALIARFRDELHSAVRATAPLFSGLFSDTGLIVNLLA